MMADVPVLEEILTILRSRREAARLHRFEIIGVFGSVARGQATASSDVDIVIEATDAKASLLDMGAIWSDLSEALGRNVDLLELDAVRPGIREAVQRDLARL